MVELGEFRPAWSTWSSVLAGTLPHLINSYVTGKYYHEHNVLAHARNSNGQKAEGGGSFKFETSLVSELLVS